ncbi:MAG: sodium:proton antiporter [bacterium]|nr:sodium:proton antiporter [bacterium]MDT8367348.1 sodium:proton antiporter [bacterium]
MALSLAFIVLAGLLADALFRRMRLPGLVGMLIVGVLVGPHMLDILRPDMMAVSGDFRKIALIVILLRAGLELRRDILHKVGPYAVTMSAVPAIFEITAITLLAPPLLGLSWPEAAILGSILGAVSPAVVVPLMIDFMERGKGSEKGIPTLILGASAIDDVFVIVIFTVLLGMYGGGPVNWVWQAASIPISIILGILLGLAVGYLLYRLFRRYDLKPPRRTIILMGVAILLTWVEDILHGILPISALLGVMAMGFIILEKQEAIAHIISSKLKHLWVFAELLLFVLVGAQVNIKVAWEAGLAGGLLILAGLAARSVGTWISLAGSGLDAREKLFAVVAYIPKATVQAAIGAIPLAAGLPGGEVILAVAVLSILITAPTGAIGIKFLGERILQESKRSPYSFKELRQSLGLPHVGERIMEIATGHMWKVIEEKESWHESESGDPIPAIVLRIWEKGDETAIGSGPTRYLKYTPLEEPFGRKWEVVYGK